MKLTLVLLLLMWLHLILLLLLYLAGLIGSDLVADVIVKSGRVVFDSMVNFGLCS